MSILQICTFDECDRSKIVRGYCSMHYKRLVRQGVLTTEITESRKLKKEYKAEYYIYKAIVQRCFNKNNKNYFRYGGRGIAVCDKWIGKDGFYNFIKDMGGRPEPTFSIDRIDNNGGYNKNNCRWATKQEQVINRNIGKNNTSGYRNVTFYKRTPSRPWRAYIRRNSKMTTIGYYKTPEEANTAVIEYTKNI